MLWPLQQNWLLPWKIGIKTGRAFEQKFLAGLSVVVLGLLYFRLAPHLSLLASNLMSRYLYGIS